MKLLLIDDEEPVREILSLSLRSDGYEVITAGDGEEGIRLFQQEKPPIVLTDIKMPGMDGIEVLKKIKQIDPETEVIIITGHGDMDLAIQSLKLEASDFITKPIKDEALAIALKRAIKRREMRQKLNEYTTSLENKVREAIEEIRIKEMQLFQSRKLAALGTLLAGVAHELNNPLSNIYTSCQILLEEIESPDLDFKKQLLKQIEEQTNKARNIVRSLLEFSRQREFKKEILNLKEIMEETIGFVQGQIPPKVEMIIEIPDDIEIYADKQHIEQAFLNIITNAIQAIPDKGTVSIKASVDKDKGVVNIEFKDTGVGIEPDILPRIFDPFFTTKEVGEGSGLGLFITHEIIERHQGHIAVESEVGKGTTFLIKMPLEKVKHE
ncbi:MAG TPA: response regulator [Candidatus Desulfofervidus auxilii]|uniref:histidine kinase n=1 Tax=Desulfofervidus auxilii TaxID=1621989 RepID=A0A7C0U3U4_DESA2|nr:response regulator [Candidatus Desulfofervidus auxilii]